MLFCDIHYIFYDLNRFSGLLTDALVLQCLSKPQLFQPYSASGNYTVETGYF